MSLISRKNQVTLPAAVLREAGLEPGDDVVIRATGEGHLELVRTTDLVEKYAGIFDASVYPPGYLDEVRRGWQ